MKQLGKIKVDAKTVWGVIGAVAWLVGTIAGRKNDAYAQDVIVEEATKKATEAVLKTLSSGND